MIDLSSEDGVAPSSPNMLSLSPYYPNYGSNWNDYVQRESLGSVTNGRDEVCNPSTYSDYTACIHGGEVRKVIIPEIINCNEYEIRDVLGAFRWKCQKNGQETIIYSHSFQDGKGLKGLLSATSWLENSVEVLRNGKVVYKTHPARWWSNPVQSLPDNSSGPIAELNQAQTIYTLANSRSSNGYYTTADKIAVVTLEEAELQYAGDGTLNCDRNTTTPVGADYIALICLGNVSYLWLEGKFNAQAPTGTDADYAVLLHYLQRSRIHHVQTRNSVIDGLRSESNLASQFEHLYSFTNGRHGVFVLYGELARLKNVYVANNGDTGLYAYDNFPIRVSDIVATNNANNGIAFRFQSGSESWYSGLYAAHNGNIGIFLDDLWGDAHINGVFAYNNASHGMVFDDSDYGSYHHLVAINNGGDGILMQNSGQGVLFSQIVSLQNQGYGFHTENGSQFSFAQNMIMASNSSGSCSIVGGTSPGIDNSCNSAANLVTSTVLNGALLGPINSDDSDNSSDQSGLRTYSEISDWFSFEHSGRFWGKPFAITDSNSRGPCTIGNCQIWDTTPADIANGLFNNSLDGVLANPSFDPAASCPAALHGSNALTAPIIGSFTEVFGDGIGNEDHICVTGETCVDRSFLGFATEINNDDIGDDNGFCQSDEACLFRRHIGWHQESLSNEPVQCLFADGVVSGVKMYSNQ